jgi:hypothetical protein
MTIKQEKWRYTIGAIKNTVYCKYLDESVSCDASIFRGAAESWNFDTVQVAHWSQSLFPVMLSSSTAHGAEESNPNTHFSSNSFAEK